MKTVRSAGIYLCLSGIYKVATPCNSQILLTGRSLRFVWGEVGCTWHHLF